MRRFIDVSLDNLVCVEIPDDLDTETNEGNALVKKLAKKKFIELLDSDFDIQIDPSPRIDT